MISSEDAKFMARAIQLAQRGRYTCTPNPCVGAVIVVKGDIVGEGWHERAGEAHAEVNAIAAAGSLTQGATLYVTLEPCSHSGRTGPCTEAVMQAGISRVVYGHEDPNPEVCGNGIKILREAGVDVQGPLMEVEARALNAGYIKRRTTGLPWVRIKSAMSLDGRTAMPDNNSFWITGPNARADVQRLRGRSCALISGWKTVQQDQATLTVRPEEFGLDEPGLGDRQPLRVLVDSHLRLSQDARFFKTRESILVANVCEDGRHEHIERRAYANEGAKQVDLEALLLDLASRGCNEVLVEAGASLSGAFFRLGLVDELIVYVAPKVMGSDARALFDVPLRFMDEALPVRFTDVRSVGRDIRITAVPETE